MLRQIFLRVLRLLLKVLHLSDCLQIPDNCLFHMFLLLDRRMRFFRLQAFSYRLLRRIWQLTFRQDLRRLLQHHISLFIVLFLFFIYICFNNISWTAFNFFIQFTDILAYKSDRQKLYTAYKPYRNHK